MLAENVFQFGLIAIGHCNLDGIVPFVGCAIVSMHSWRLAKGPEQMLPSPSIAYQPALMPRMSDLCSLMYWGAITVRCSCAQQVFSQAGLTAGARARLPRPKSLLQVLGLPTAPVLPIVKTETSAGLDFMGSFSGKNCLPCVAYGYANFEHNRRGARFGALSFNTMILQHYVARSLSLRRLKEPNATADRYIDGHGMSFGLEDQKPQLKPPSPAGAFLSGWLTFVAVAIRFKSSCSK
jgi:hypothetical protein